MSNVHAFLLTLALVIGVAWTAVILASKPACSPGEIAVWSRWNQTWVCGRPS